MGWWSWREWDLTLTVFLLLQSYISYAINLIQNDILLSHTLKKKKLLFTGCPDVKEQIGGEVQTEDSGKERGRSCSSALP